MSALQPYYQNYDHPFFYESNIRAIQAVLKKLFRNYYGPGVNMTAGRNTVLNLMELVFRNRRDDIIVMNCEVHTRLFDEIVAEIDTIEKNFKLDESRLYFPETDLRRYSHGLLKTRNKELNKGFVLNY